MRSSRRTHERRPRVPSELLFDRWQLRCTAIDVPPALSRPQANASTRSDPPSTVPSSVRACPCVRIPRCDPCASHNAIHAQSAPSTASSLHRSLRAEHAAPAPGHPQITQFEARPAQLCVRIWLPRTACPAFTPGVPER
ncbi:hypothetical protein EVG20_g7805 [Dentipellis fragilis]|uniref:Uncharacterized protein n=1 Tax=Dentipellis fragilis TaxID=205917 RepID=A0A4Y9YCU8_9AGAM|nr:hypothetical protein EVG20_g7805 [Dentipellis fragilis]